MPKLQDILYKAPIREVRGDLSAQVVDFTFDSREVGQGWLFVAQKGVHADGHRFIGKAIEAGATAIVCEEWPEEVDEQVVWVLVENSSVALAHIAANYFGNPADELEIVGVTGTNGKTTTATLLFELFNSLGHQSGLLSTVAVRMGDKTLPATHTTPDAKQLHRTFRQMVEEGCTHCFMEVSSHALVQDRVAGIRFAGAIFTNITRDHLDYHGTFKEYIAAKKILFDGLSADAFALVNADDRNGSVMVQNTRARRLTFGVKRMGDYKARILENTFEGLLLDVNGHEAWFRLIGSFNAYNLLSVYGTAVELGMEAEKVLLHLSRIEGVAGRFQTLRNTPRNLTAIVDYAHTPDALQNVLETIRDIQGGGGQVITVVGCGGDRDKGKRPLMAGIAAQYSDQVILTSDNPRSEDPFRIIEDMWAGVPVSARRKVRKEVNRREAIEIACSLAQSHDIILVAGKGHENYQEIQGVKHPFDDREILEETFKTLEN